MKKIDRGLFIAIVMAIGMATLSGCASTMSAYKAAEGLDQTAYVMNQHYLGLVREANRLAEAGELTGSSLATAQDLVRSSRPLLAGCWRLWGRWVVSMSPTWWCPRSTSGTSSRPSSRYGSPLSHHPSSLGATTSWDRPRTPYWLTQGSWSPACTT